MTRFIILIIMLTMLSCNSNNSKSTPIVTIPVENITATNDQQARRSQSEAYCKAHSIPVYSNPNALFVDPEDSVIIRTKDKIVDRALALYYIGLKSEGLEQKNLDEMDKNYHISSKLSENEKAYVNAKNPTDQQKSDANWRYESLHVLLWALNFIDTLSYPDHICNVADDAKILFGFTEEQFRNKAKLRSKKEILDQADLILRIDWACVNAREKKVIIPGSLDKDVVFERHHALNWLINYLQEDWDDVTTDT